MEIFSAVVAVVCLAIALYCWTHESPKLRNEREGREKKTFEDHKTLQEATLVKVEAIQHETAVEAARIAVERDRKTRDPDKLTTPAERVEITVLAEASADSAILTLGSAATLFEPLVYGSMGTDRPKEEPPKK